MIAAGADKVLKGRDAEIVEALRTLYPDAATELKFSNEYQLVVAVLLSAQCTDKKVNEVTPDLFERYPDFGALSKARLPSLEKIIRPINYYRTKSRHLVAMAKLVIDRFGGELPRSREELTTLPGVGRKTASVVLSELGAEHALPVDTHVFRVALRLEIAKGKNVLEVEESLCKRFPPLLWHPLHHWLILHGRRVCKAQRPLCATCLLNKLCPSSRV